MFSIIKENFINEFSCIGIGGIIKDPNWINVHTSFTFYKLKQFNLLQKVLFLNFFL